MKRMILATVRLWCAGSVLIWCLGNVALRAETNSATDNSGTASSALVPRLIQFTGALKDPSGQSLTGVQGVTFAFYKDQSEGAPLWLETQNVSADEQGRFAVLLGAAKPEGLPLDLFTSGNAQWLGVQPAGLPEQPRTFLASAPYALAIANTASGPVSVLNSSPGTITPQASGVSNTVVSVTTNPGSGLQSLTTPVTGSNVNVNIFMQPCGASSGQVLEWNGSLWGCATPVNSLTAGTGLTATTSSIGAATVGVAMGGITNSMLATSNISLAPGAGLIGGGSGSLGGSIPSIGIDPNVVATKSGANTFNAPLSVNASLSVVTGAPPPPPAPTRDATKAATGDPAVSDNPPQSDLAMTALNTAILGTNNAVSGVGVGGISASPSGYGGAFQNTTGGKSLAALDSSGNDIFDVFANGNVGIGQPIPGFRLDVGGQINASAGLCIAGTCQTSWPPPGVTQVISGPGLTGGSITSTGTIGVANGGITNTMLQNSSVTVPVGQGLTGGGAGPLGGTVPEISIPNLGITTTLLADASVTAAKVDATVATQAALTTEATTRAAADTSLQAAVNGKVASVAAGTGLIASPSPITTTGTLSLNTTFTDGRYARLGAGNTFIGTQNITGGLTVSGNLVLPITTGSAGVILLGPNIRFLHTYGTNNTFMGQAAGNFSLTGGYNTGIGQGTLRDLTTGPGNSAFGMGALHLNTTGDSNTALGQNALNINTTGNYNTAVGQATLLNNNGDANTALGWQAMVFNTTGQFNTAVGLTALNKNTTANANTAVGMSALYNNTTGNANTAAGQAALNSNTTGNGNTADGWNAGFTSNSANANTTGSNNTFIGFNSGPGVDGTTTPLSNATAIGANAAVSADNSLVLGDSSVSVGIGTQAPVAKLQVQGGDVYLSTVATGIILKSPKGTCARITIADGTGALVSTVVSCQ